MQTLGTQRIETKRLILRRFTMKDVLPMYHNWASDPEVTKYLMWPAHSSPRVTETVLREWIQNYEQDDFYQWAIVLKENGEEPIGSISVVSQDAKTGKAQVGYCIGKKWWHKGVMSEALEAVIAFLFGKVGAQRVESRHDPRNPNSGAVMRKCGMKFEGVRRQSLLNRGEYVDVGYCSILASEYFQ